MKTNLRAMSIIAALTCDASIASAQSLCRVTDPTGTPLNVRTLPNGKIIGTLPNRMPVVVVDQTVDQDHRSWVFLKRGTDDEPIGWVFRSFINCPD